MSAKTKPRRLWTEKEDEILRAEATRQLALGSLNTWTSIAAKLPSRTNKDCRKRWSKICTNVNRGAWTEEEDSKLLAAVDKHGCQWTQVAMVVGTRHADQCSKRWQHSLDPSLDRSKWKPEEYARLRQAVAKHGRSWKVIAEKEFPGRSNSDLKNRYGILEKKSLADGGSRAASLLPMDSRDKVSAAESSSMNNPEADQLHWDFDTDHSHDTHSQFQGSDLENREAGSGMTRGRDIRPDGNGISSEASAQVNGQDDSCDEMDDEDTNQFNEMEFDVNMDVYLDDTGHLQRNDFDLSATSTSLPLMQANTSDMLIGDMFPGCSNNFELGDDPGLSSCRDQMNMDSIEALISGNDIAWTPKPDYVFSPDGLDGIDRFIGKSNSDNSLMNLSGRLWEAEDNNLEGDQQPHEEQLSQETRSLQIRNSNGKREIESVNRRGELSYSQPSDSLSLNAVQDGDSGASEGGEQRNRTTLVLDDVQPGTLSRIMNILIQDKIKLKLESQQ